MHITYDEKTFVVWGVGNNPEASKRSALRKYQDDHSGVGYEFSCWCADLNTVECSMKLAEKVKQEGRLSVSENELIEQADI